ncbi:hypothetical protein J2Z40_002624 [Cytobacillus eiseniae]|uniref:DUF4230 domain-containing protein n=1 Tax=Cytobacillus eiseniae TaxID=762947 RepID=A0ABS4RI29_9BACI|nr:DUF4230 domain-containing protein [Cytobacillus eiseniae]MBP2242051.1 hypothetical protein [Cytobacillus eiseniae]
MKTRSERKAAQEEILAGKKETAAAIAMETKYKPRFSIPFLSSFLKIRVLLIAIILFLAGSLGAFTYYKLFAGSTFKSETISIVESVQELATLATAQAVVTAIIKEEDNKLFNKELNVNFPGTKRTTLLIVPATVLAGVDLQMITDKDIVIDEDSKKITMTIPHATMLQDPSIQMDKIQTYSEEGLFRSEMKWDEGFDLTAAAQKQIIEEAMELGLLAKAEDSAVKVLTPFFHQLGYEATIQFK